MKKLVPLLVTMALYSAMTTARAQSPNHDYDPKKAKIAMEFMVPGNFVLIGKAPDSDRMYFGRISIKKTADGFEVVRTISGKRILGTAAVESVPSADDAPALSIKFTEAGRSYQEFCAAQLDLDNDARITCLVYKSDTRTRRVGYEAFFGAPHNPNGPDDP